MQLAASEKLSLRGIAILILIAIIPFMRFTYQGRGLVLLSLLIVIPLFIFGTYINRQRLDKIQIIIIAFLVINTLTRFYTPVTYFDPFNVNEFKANLFAIFIFLHRPNRYETNAIKTISLITAIIFIVLSYFFGELYLNGIRNRIVFQENLVLDPNMVTASFILPVLLLLNYSIKNKNILTTFLAITLIFTSLYTVYNGGSRGGLLAILLSSLYLIYLNLEIKHFFKILFIIVISIAGISILFSYLPAEIMERMTMNSVIEDNGSGRIDIWQSQLDYFFSKSNFVRLLFGYGQGSVKPFFGDSSHSTFIEYLWEMGLLGLIVYFYLLFRLMHYSRIRKSTVGMSLLIGVIVWTIGISTNGQLIFWALLYTVYSISFNSRAL